MKEKGIVIFEDGNVLPFGTYVCPDEEGYFYSPTHEADFQKEVVSSIEFKLSDHYYIDEDSLYKNALRLSLEGLAFIFNNKAGVNKPTEILAYMPENPTSEQLEALKLQKKILETEINNIYVFQSYDFDDFTTFDTLQDYIKKNINTK